MPSNDLIPEINLKVRGGNPIYGKIELSGDPYSAIFLMASFIAQKKSGTIRNVPRAEYVNQFIHTAELFNIDIKWTSIDSVQVVHTENIKTDLTVLDQLHLDKFGMLFVSIFLNVEGECRIPLNFMRSDLKLMREIGVKVELENEAVHFRTPINIAELATKVVEVRRGDMIGGASKLLLGHTFTNLKVNYNKRDRRFLVLTESFSIKNNSEIFNVYSQKEFNFYAFLSLLPSSEISIKNFDLSQSLAFLMAIREVGGLYEVQDNQIKLWYQGESSNKDIFDFRGLTTDALGYLFILATYYSERPIKILSDKLPALPKLVTDLNIIGCRIDMNEVPEGHVILIRPTQNLNTVKAIITEPEWGGVLLAAALVVKANNTVNNVESFSNLMPYLLSNLESLQVSFISTT